MQSNLHSLSFNLSFSQFYNACKGGHILGRVGEAEEVAKAIVFLASDDASFITATCLPVDGGLQAMCPLAKGPDAPAQ